MAIPDRNPLSDRPCADDSARELVLAVVGAHSGSLLALARRYSYCADDAHDAYQRALEIFLRRAGSVDPARAPAWLRTVVKHEAMAVRAARARIVGPVEVDLDRSEARELVPADELAAASERDGRSAEALARLKPQEVRALVLKARGYSYREICEITGWTYTKVNRCLTEGRRAFLARFADIEAGRECDRWAPTLSALADGEASPGDLAAIRPHLRHCPGCRARLRDFRTAPRAVAALAPLPLAMAGGDAPATAEAAIGGGDHGAGVAGVLSRVHDAVAAGWHERVLLSAHKVQAGVEAASAGKLAAVAASATALAGGGAAALTDVAAGPSARPAAAVSGPASSRGESRGAATAPRDAAAPAPTPAGEALAGGPARGEGPLRSPERSPRVDGPGEFGPGGDLADRPVASAAGADTGSPGDSRRATSSSSSSSDPPAPRPAPPSGTSAPTSSSSPAPSSPSEFGP